MFCHDGYSSALNFLLFYNQWRPEGGTLLLAFHDSLCSIFFTRSSSPRRLLTSNWMSRGGTRTSYPCQLMVSNRLAATGPYSLSPFSSTSSPTPPIPSILRCKNALPHQRLSQPCQSATGQTSL